MVSSHKNNLKTNSKDLQPTLFQLKKDILQKSEFLREVIIITFGNWGDFGKMAALPQGAFIACKLGEQVRDKNLIVSRIKSSGEKKESRDFSGNKKLMEFSPVKYNEKLMNSIWGFYNRYSPHNIKSNEIVSNSFVFNQQQRFAVANQAIANNIAMAATTGKKYILMENKLHKNLTLNSPF